MKNDFRHIRSHTFRGRRYKIRWRKPRDKDIKSKMTMIGQCDSPESMNPVIKIDPKIDEPLLLCTLIDESLHACFFDIDNDTVDEAASDIAKFLQRVGFRLCK